MPSFGKRVDGPDGRRRVIRQPVVLAASALAVAGSRSVLVADLSSVGAKLQGRDLPIPGSEVLVAVGTQESFGTIVWGKEDACGISFDHPLGNDKLDRFKQEGSWASVTGAMA